MLETSTFYLLLSMGAFIAIALTIVHHHTNADLIRRKESETQGFKNKIAMKIDVIEQEISDLKIKISEIDQQIDSYITETKQ